MNRPLGAGSLDAFVLDIDNFDSDELSQEFLLSQIDPASQPPEHQQPVQPYYEPQQQQQQQQQQQRQLYPDGAPSFEAPSEEFVARMEVELGFRGGDPQQQQQQQHIAIEPVAFHQPHPLQQQQYYAPSPDPPLIVEPPGSSGAGQFILKGRNIQGKKTILNPASVCIYMGFCGSHTTSLWVGRSHD